jgi:hypothetical protein
MRKLLAFTVFLLMAGQIFSFDAAIGPLSAKNILLYMILMGLFGHAAIRREWTIDHAKLQALFTILVGYAVVTWVVLSFMVEVPRYRPITEALAFKNTLFNEYIFFLVFFYGAKSASDAWAIMKALFIAVACANLITVLDTFHIVRFGVIEEGIDGRAQGAMGEQNQYAAFVNAFVWALAAEAFAAPGRFKRWFWGLSAFVSLIALLITISRGGFVGMAVALLWGTYLFRKRLSLDKIVSGGLIFCGVCALLLVVIGAQYGSYIQQRVVEMFTKNASEASSGRTDLWAQALRYLMEEPTKMITGFGWDMWGHMPFSLVSHNHYLDLWFNLGLIGVGCFLGILGYIVNAARTAAARAAGTPDEYRYMAFVYGTIALAASIFFVNLYTPWPYIWAYVALMMRVALGSRTQDVKEAARPAPVTRPGPRYGWVGSTRV